jgi:hypothetical protein
MRSSLALTATVLAVGWVAPASAQMCGAGQTTGSIASAPAGGGMMCGMSARPTAASNDPMTDTRSPSQQSAQGGCPCCRHMAMMGGGSGGMGGMMGGSGSSSQAPAQQPSTPPSGGMPGMPGMTPRQ